MSFRNKSYGSSTPEVARSAILIISKNRERGLEISDDSRADFYWAKHHIEGKKFDGQRYEGNLRDGNKDAAASDKRAWRKSKYAWYEMKSIERGRKVKIPWTATQRRLRLNPKGDNFPVSY